MLPYFDQPAWQVGPLTIHAFGVAVAAALALGTARARRRHARLGLDPHVGERLGWWTIAGGVLGAHLFSVLLYFPAKLRDDPWLLLRLWEDVSSFGGMLGGLAGAALFLACRVGEAERRDALAYLDVLAWVFPASLAVGRVGCALAHDHPGVVTDAPLAIALRSDAAFAYMAGVYEAAGLTLQPDARALGFHDLGLYEALWLALVVVPAFAWWGRRARPAGFFLAAFAALYLPLRFWLDTLRVADARYAGLTPAQWVAAAVLAALPFLALPRRRRTMRYAAGAAAVLGVAWACTSAAAPNPSASPPAPLHVTATVADTVLRPGAPREVRIAVEALGAPLLVAGSGSCTVRAELRDAAGRPLEPWRTRACTRDCRTFAFAPGAPVTRTDLLSAEPWSAAAGAPARVPPGRYQLVALVEGEVGTCGSGATVRVESAPIAVVVAP